MVVIKGLGEQSLQASGGPAQTHSLRLCCLCFIRAQLYVASLSLSLCLHAATSQCRTFITSLSFFARQTSKYIFVHEAKHICNFIPSCAVNLPVVVFCWYCSKCSQTTCSKNLLPKMSNSASVIMVSKCMSVIIYRGKLLNLCWQRCIFFCQCTSPV